MYPIQDAIRHRKPTSRSVGYSIPIPIINVNTRSSKPKHKIEMSVVVQN
jgi:hypothetical protein